MGSSGTECPLGDPLADWQLVHLNAITTKIGSGATP